MDLGVEVEMLTFMSRKQRDAQKEYYDDVIKLDNVKVIITPHERLNTFYTSFYLILNIIVHGKVSLVAKKADLLPLRLVKLLLPKRFRYVLELEGDAISENDYLKRNQYKKGFYDNYLKSASKSIEEMPSKLSKADGLLVLSTGFKKVLLERYSFLTPQQIKVISTGFTKGRFKFSKDAREQYRKRLSLENETTFMYAGNLFYSWQNIKKTLKLFSYYIANVDSTAKFVILTHETDQYIALEMIEKLKIPSSSIIIKEVHNSEISNYYNAADICLLLRGNDLMNEVASPGKIGEYAASGAPTLTSKYIGDYSKLFKGQKLIEQVSDISDMLEMSKKIKDLLTATDIEREALSKWSNEKLSSENNATSFISAFDV